MVLNSYQNINYLNILSSFAVIRDKTLLKCGYKYNITYTTFPDNGYFALQSAIYLLEMPDYVLYVNSSNVNYMPTNSWVESAINKMIFQKSDVLFGGNTTFQNKTVGIGVAILKASIVRELLYYTNSTFTSIPPLLAVSLLPRDKIRIVYNHFDGIKPLQNYDHITKVEQLRYQKCSIVSNTTKPTLAVMIPLFKRQNIYEYIKSFENETYKANFYLLVQCENRFTLNLKLVQSNIKRRVPVYHIWCYNWSPLFMFPLYVTGMLPVDFVMRWDDDERPFGNQTHNNLIERVKNDDNIAGLQLFNDNRIRWEKDDGNAPFCGRTDHIAAPMMYRPTHAKIAARTKVITFAHGEDIYVSVSSNIVCNTNMVFAGMPFDMNGEDGLKHENDEEMKKAKNYQGAMYFVWEIYNDYRRRAKYVPQCLVNENTTSRGNFALIEFAHTDLFK
ncbi:hypothetical protein GPJ56_009586 [Histomonas meleagridis]|uniref:uncharacterized protein n=1 Tax=Histomonas meleagridis TaxID=135588 RepID=UPI00355ABD27|nr:hypothetical protein GPJ56_009586 [Histomonas meleagridis]KAH0799646.1 hypothetical protein GO595_007560 [Histomonas meleagridis]